MAVIKSTDVARLLGKQVALTRHTGPDRSDHSGIVVAVVVALPGSRANASIMVEESATRCDYFDLEDITIRAVI